MNILITDDEPLARQRLRRLLNDLSSEHQLFEANTGIEAVKICDNNRIDLAFMDIRMPQMDGLEAAHHLTQMKVPPAVVFVTAYDDYALEAFSVNAIDYLLKPIQRDKLEQAITKASQLNPLQLNKVTEDSPERHQRNHISARLRGEIQLIPIHEIYFFQADQKYVCVKHKEGEALIEEPLKQLEQELSDGFVRIHRNALVNKRYITGLTKDSAGHLFMTIKHYDEPLEVSRRHASHIRKLIKSL